MDLDLSELFVCGVGIDLLYKHYCELCYDPCPKSVNHSKRTP